MISIFFAAAAAFAAHEPLNVLVPVNWTGEPPAKIVPAIRGLHARGFNKFVLVSPWFKRYFGRGDVAAYAQTGRDIALAKETLKDLDGVKIGWWLAPSIGNSRDFPGQRIMDCDGNVTYSSCPLSEEFAAALCERVEACVKAARPEIVFVEDDYTLSNHGGMNKMKGCFCPLHLDVFAKRVGRAYSAKEVAAMFRNPAVANAPLRKAFAELSRDSLAALASKIRASIDKVDPAIRVCLCQSGFADIDGDATEKVARAFAGGTQPMVRIFGTGYYEENAAKLPEIVSHTIHSAQTLSPDIELIHETDPYPHNRFYNSSLFLISEIAAAVMSGVDGSFYYCTQYADDPLEDPGYADRFRSEAVRLGAVRDLRRTMRPCGVRMAYDPKEVYMFRETEKSSASGMLPVAARFLGKMGLPATAAKDASVTLICGTAPNGFSDAEIEAMLSGGALIDAEAALILAKRGFEDLMGCGVSDFPERIYFTDEMILPTAGCRRSGKKLYHRRIDSKPIIGWTPKKSATALLSPRPGAEEWSALFDIDGRKVAPATVFYRNAKGGRVGVMSRSLDAAAHPSIYCARKQELLMNLFAKLSDGRMEVCAPETPGTWLLTARNDRELMVMAENLAGEERDDIVLKFSSEWRGAKLSVIRADGSREPVGVASERFLVPPGMMPPTRPVFFTVTKP